MASGATEELGKFVRDVGIQLGRRGRSADGGKWCFPPFIVFCLLPLNHPQRNFTEMHYAGRPLTDTLFNSAQPTAVRRRLNELKMEVNSFIIGAGERKGASDVTNLFHSRFC